ncbi:hypothetical protein [Paraburkholderia youngii]|uniref:hypothetical protein n=1 Tax=Paraburkholderia youngii TaxID=2782701 RepID=UPI003D261093
MMLAGPYAKADPEILDVLATRGEPSDMQIVLKAAEIPYREIKEHIEAYHRDHPARNIFAGIEEFLQQHAPKQGPRDGIWTVDEKRFGRWRFRLLFHPANDNFLFDAFDESGGTGSFTEATAFTVLRRQASGQWLAGTTDRKDRTLRLTGFTKEITEQLEEMAADYGFGLSVEGVRRCSPAQAGLAPAHTRFLERMRKEHPEALAGGRFA